jgi:hypothetical protein
MPTSVVEAAPDAAIERRRTADRVFTGALAFNVAMTALWLFMAFGAGSNRFFAHYELNLAAFGRVAVGVVMFNVVWGFIWYGIKSLLLKYLVGFSKAERRQAFSSRMHEPFDVAALVQRYSERRIRIVDMIGRRGRFITLASAGVFYLYLHIKANPTPDFATGFVGDNLFDALATSWIFLAFYYADNVVAAAFYGPQSRVMDGVLARANCLLISTLWGAFRFVMVPIGGRLAALFPPSEFAVLFMLIWGSYVATDACAEIGGSLFGRQTIKVWGIGDVNRKSIEGTLSGFAGSVILCLTLVLSQGLPAPAPWIALAIVISISNTLLELYSPRGTDDFTMATSNALICWAFGVLSVR